MTRWLRDLESRVAHAYARASHVARCGKALRAEAEGRESRIKIERCRSCRSQLCADEAREKT